MSSCRDQPALSTSPHPLGHRPKGGEDTDVGFQALEGSQEAGCKGPPGWVTLPKPTGPVCPLPFLPGEGVFHRRTLEARRFRKPCFL